MTTLAKQRIKNVFNDVAENVSLGKKADVSNTMRKHGYSDSSSKALKVKETKTWKALLEEVDDNVLLEKLKEIAKDSDKRASISAIQELFKLKDKYPAGKLKVTQYEEELTDLTSKEQD